MVVAATQGRHWHTRQHLAGAQRTAAQAVRTHSRCINNAIQHSCTQSPTPHLNLGVRRAAQQHKLPSSLTGAPGCMLNQVDTLLVDETGNTGHLQRGEGEGARGGPGECLVLHVVVHDHSSSAKRCFCSYTSSIRVSSMQATARATTTCVTITPSAATLSVHPPVARPHQPGCLAASTQHEQLPCLQTHIEQQQCTGDSQHSNTTFGRQLPTGLKAG